MTNSRSKSLSKKEALLSVGKDLILSKGFNATPIDEICEKAGVTKGAFFHYFKSKQDYAEALIDYIWQPILAMREAAIAGEVAPLEHLHNHIDFMSTFMLGDGRLMGMLMQELGESHPHIRTLLRGRFEAWTLFLSEDLTRAKTRHAPDADFDVEGVIDHILAVIEGSPILSRLRGENSVQHAVEHLKRYLDSLFAT